MNKTIKLKDPVYGLILRADIDLESDQVKIPSIKLSLPKKASKLEKLLLKYTEIYAYDMIRNNFYDTIVQSKEYQKLLAKNGRIKTQTSGKTSKGRK